MSLCGPTTPFCKNKRSCILVGNWLFILFLLNLYGVLPYMARNKYRTSHACGFLMSWSRFLFLLDYNLPFLKIVLEYFHIVLSSCLFLKKDQDCDSGTLYLLFLRFHMEIKVTCNNLSVFSTDDIVFYI